MKIVELSDAAELIRFRQGWNELAANADGGDVFLTFEWLVPWLNAYWQGKRIAFLFAFDHDVPVAVVPLVPAGGGVTRCAGSLASPVNPHTRWQGILFRGDPLPVFTSVLKHLRDREGGGCVRFRLLDGDGAAARTLVPAAREVGMLTLTRLSEHGLLIDLSHGWEPYVAHRSRQLVREMRRKTRKVEGSGEWTFRQFCAADEWTEASQAVLAVEARSWKHGKGTAIGNEPNAAPFYHELARLNAARGRLEIHLLEHRGKPVAHLFGLVDGLTFFALKTAYDGRYSPWAPGAVLMWHVLEQEARNGRMFVDLLGDVAPWKLSLSNHTKRCVNITVFPRRCIRCHIRRSLHWSAPFVRRSGIKRLAERFGWRAAP